MVRTKQRGFRIQDTGFKKRVSGAMKWALGLLLVTCHASLVTGALRAQSQPFGSANLNNIRYANQFPGATGTAKLNAAIADLGPDGGVVIAPPGTGTGVPTTYPNNVAVLDLRQIYDVIGGSSTDPDRAPLFLLENRLGEMTTKPVIGTVTLTNGSTAVTGVGTQFMAQFDSKLGRSIKLDSDTTTSWAQVASVQSDTQMTLVTPYPGTGGTGAASYFITQLGFVVNNILDGGAPNTMGGGEGVGITSINWRTGGTRSVFGGNFNVGYHTRDPNAAAVGLELDISNYSNADADPATNVEEGLRLVSAGPKRVGTGIHMLKLFGGGEFVRGLWIDNSYSSHGIHINGPSNHVYLVPNADNNSPMLVGRNAADAATKWAVNNDGSAQFDRLATGPASGSFGSTSQYYLGDSTNVVAALNASQSAAFSAVNQSTSTSFQVGAFGVAATEHTSGTKDIAIGLEGDAHHESSGSVTILSGVLGYTNMSGSGGTVGMMSGLYAATNAKSAGTVNNNYGLFVDTQTAGTNNWAIYTKGTAPVQFEGPVISGLNTVTFSSTPAFDAKLGNTQKITLTGNVTSSTLSNATGGEQIHFLICQDATGSRTFVWPSNVKGGMTIGSSASTCSAQNFIFDGTNAYALSSGVTNM